MSAAIREVELICRACGDSWTLLAEGDQELTQAQVRCVCGEEGEVVE